jgi:DNA-binding MarR family transcriptional regulator
MEPQSLIDNIAYLVGHVTHLMSTQVSRLFRERKYPVTVEQFTILTVLWYEDGLPQKSIAKRLHRDKTTITRVIDNMVKENLVVRVPSENDKRIKLIFLTHKGRSLENELVMSSGEVYLKAIYGLTETEIISTNSVLNKIIKNLN